jgi:hypothetical protein
MAKINSGPIEATYKFKDVPKTKWASLVSVKRDFLAVRIKHDCRCLLEFCQEAEIVWQELGFKSASDMICNGYELDPVEIDFAVAWLKHNEPNEAIGLDAVKAQVAEARDDPLADHGEIGNGRKDESRVDNVNSTKGGNDTTYTLRRLARDKPELLDKIEAGELTVNQAAIQAGIRKKPTPEDQCLRAFKKCSDKAGLLLRLQEYLEAVSRHKESTDGRRLD